MDNNNHKNFWSLIRQLLKEKEIIILLFFIFFLAFNAPYLIDKEREGVDFYFFYHYITWGVAIIVLFLISISCDNSD